MHKNPIFEQIEKRHYYEIGEKIHSMFGNWCVIYWNKEYHVDMPSKCYAISNTSPLEFWRKHLEDKVWFDSVCDSNLVEAWQLKEQLNKHKNDV